MIYYHFQLKGAQGDKGEIPSSLNHFLHQCLNGYEFDQLYLSIHLLLMGSSLIRYDHQ